MNFKILQKVLDELGKDKADLSYIKGMVETLIAMQPEESGLGYETSAKLIATIADDTRRYHGIPTLHDKQKDEGSLLDAKARASLQQIKSLADKSIE